MIKLYGREFSKQDLLTRIGDMSQIAGVRRSRLADGSEAGVEAIDFRTGSGLNFTVLASRGMDISLAEYRGKPLSWRSATGDIAPAFFEEEGLGWLRGFYGGLVVTCGLTSAGAPSVDQGKPLGLHGRFSNTPAKNVYADAAWDGENYVVWAQGKVREAAVFGENICLTRKISARLGESRLFIHDIVENLGHDPVEHMILYHINLGFPVVDSTTELLSPTLELIPRDAKAEEGKEDYYRFTAPVPGFKEKVYTHVMGSNEKGEVLAALVNRGLPKGEEIGVYVKYLRNELPEFTEWKMIGQGTYVVGLEPGNCRVGGRDKERARGALKYLQPGEKKEYHVEIGVLASVDEMNELEAKIKGMKP